MNTALRASRRLSTDSTPGSSTRRQSSQTRIPMTVSRSAANRLTTTQSTYDFLAGGAGESSPHGLRQTARRPSITSKGPLRPSSRPPSRPGSRQEERVDKGEELQAQLKTAQYELNSLKQEKDVTKLKHEKEIRDLQAKHEAEVKKLQTSENSDYVPLRKYDALAKELSSVQDANTNKSADLEKKLRTLQEENRSLSEELNETSTELASQARQNKYQLQDIETKHAKLVQTLNDLRADLENKENALQNSQRSLTERDAEFDNLEAELLRLRAQEGDIEELGLVKRELTEQVGHIRQLETKNREQNTELRRFREQAKAISVVEEEKRGLELQVARMDELERELGEAKFQRQMLEDERSAWVSYLQNSMTDGEIEFHTPEAMARALTEERHERANLVDKLGSLQPQLAEKDAKATSLETELQRLKGELEKVKTSGSGIENSSSSNESKARVRLERQKNLATKEIEYLRAQLKTFESEDTTDLNAGHSIDPQARDRIVTLEDLATSYRNEIDTLNTTLSKLQSNPQQPVPEAPKSLKRPSPPADEDERLGSLTRKNATLTSDLSTLQKAHTTLTTELTAAKSQVAQLQASARTRILSLRSNPTDDHARIKASTLTTLREENTALHAQLSNAQPPGKTVPTSYLDSATLSLQALEAKLSDRDKRHARLQKIYAQKSLEFRAAVASLLGWRMDFLPGGKFRLTSLFNPSLKDQDKEDDEEREWDTSLIFDGENGTMKIAGGPQSEFGREIRGLVRFWVEERKEIPLFLAAATLEFYERSTRAGRAIG